MKQLPQTTLKFFTGSQLYYSSNTQFTSLSLNVRFKINSCLIHFSLKWQLSLPAHPIFSANVFLSSRSSKIQKLENGGRDLFYPFEMSSFISKARRFSQCLKKSLFHGSVARYYIECSLRVAEKCRSPRRPGVSVT